MKQNLITVELLDGTVQGPIRVLFADKIRYERAARANQWGATEEIRLQGFLAWAALERTGQTTESYEAWLELVADVHFQTGVDPAATGGADDEPDPTQAGISA